MEVTGMKRLALVTLALFAACGTESTETEVATEAVLGAPVGMYHVVAGGTNSWVQQVPYDSFLNHTEDSLGTRYEFNRNITAILTEGKVMGSVSGPTGDDFRLSIDSPASDGTADPTNNIKCNIDLGGAIAKSGPNPNFGMYFPTSFALPGTPDGTSMYVGITGGEVFSGCSSLQSGAWGTRSIARVYVQYLNAKVAKPQGPTLATGAPNGLWVRVDINFDVDGDGNFDLTNRYFFKFHRTNP